MSPYTPRHACDPSVQLLYTAFLIALTAHKGQLRRNGEPVVLHPLRVSRKRHSSKLKIIALLHDTVEDSDITISQLREYGFSEDILFAIQCLTHKKNESWKQYVKRICKSPLAQKVKQFDIEDNLYDCKPSNRCKYLETLKTLKSKLRISKRQVATQQ